MLADTFGPTDGCRACRTMLDPRGGAHGGHAAFGRTRFEGLLKDSDEHKTILKKRDVRHGLAEADDGEGSDGEPAAKKGRIIEEPDGISADAVDSFEMFGPSDMADTGASVETPVDLHSEDGEPQEPPEKRTRISNVDGSGERCEVCL